MFYLLTSCDTAERIAQNILIHNSNDFPETRQKQDKHKLQDYRGQIFEHNTFICMHLRYSTTKRHQTHKPTVK